MKRLQCLYKPNKDKNYPWALKHPKVESALAVFKTRKDAMAWFLSLGYDCATWFQNDKKVWGGLLIAEKDEKSGKMEYELNVEKFDGNLNYDETLEELNIKPDGYRDEKAAKKALDAVVDYKILSDHHTYFPVDDDIVIERKKSKKDLEIEELKAKILELSALLSSSSADFREEVAKLMEQLQDSSTDKELLRRQIEILKARQEAEAQKEKEVVEKPVEKEVVKEIVKEVIKKEVPAQSKAVKYVNFDDLSVSDKVKALALYSKKLEKIADQLKEQAVTSEEDLKEITNNLSTAAAKLKAVESLKLEDEDLTKLLRLASFTFKRNYDAVLKMLVGSKDIKFTPATSVYVVDENGNNLKLAQVTSFVLFDYKHVGFVPEKDYHYAIFETSNESSKFLVFDWPVETVSKSEVVVTEEREEVDFWVKALFVFLLGFAYAVLATLVIVLACGVI
ncbi:MAG3090 family protein [Mycoplasma hafezii]|uniref:MAG3090 family protein n=1 Tax=Mycoplasma hafezii TaxID=525886 RepID=UPI003CF63DB6